MREDGVGVDALDRMQRGFAVVTDDRLMAKPDDRLVRIAGEQLSTCKEADDRF
jgi:hypothetical protein